MEMAREEYIRHLISEDKTLSNNPPYFVTARASAGFFRSGGLEDKLAVTVWPYSLGRSSCLFKYEIWESEANVLKATGETVEVCLDPDTEKKRAIPKPMRIAFEKDLEAGIKREEK